MKSGYLNNLSMTFLYDLYNYEYDDYYDVITDDVNEEKFNQYNDLRNDNANNEFIVDEFILAVVVFDFIFFLLSIKIFIIF